MKATLIAEAIVLLAVIAVSQSLPLGSSNPEVAQSVIPLTDLPKELPAENVDAVKAEIKPEESVATPEPENKIKEVKAAEPEPQLIDQAAILTPAVQDEPKEIVAIVEAESAVIKEEPAAPVQAVESRGAEEPKAPKLEEAAPAPALTPEAEKPAAEEESSKGLTGETLQGKPEAARSTDEVIPKEQAENLKEEPKAESAPIEKEAPAEIPKEIKEEIIVAEIAAISSAPIVEEIVKDKDAKTSVDDDLVDPADSSSSAEGARSGSEIEGDKPLEKTEEKEPKKEDSVFVAEKESRLKEDEAVLEKEEEKKEVKEEVKKVEPAAEEPKEESIKPEQLPEAQKLEEQAKKPEDSKESSEESKESEERSPEKDKNGVKNEDDSSQEQSDEEPEKTKAS